MQERIINDNASTSGVFTEITVRIPDELARLVGASGKVERRVLEALARSMSSAWDI